MPATKTQGTQVKVETAAAATKAITGLTAASPPVVTATAHGYSAGDIVRLANIGGMVQLNNRVFVVANPVTNTFELKGVDGTGYTPYTSGGDSFKLTMTALGLCSGIPSMFDGAADDIDVTHLLSVAKEKLQGLPDPGGVSLELVLDNTDTGQAAIRTMNEAQAAKGFSFTDPNAKVACCNAFAKNFKITAPQNEAWRASVDLLMQAQRTYFA